MAYTVKIGPLTFYSLTHSEKRFAPRVRIVVLLVFDRGRGVAGHSTPMCRCRGERSYIEQKC
eukprot:9712588-Heterocapsa_arctica.AAC.1